MNFLKLSRELRERGLEIFSINDVIKITGESNETVRMFLTRHVKNNNIFKIKRGYYSLNKIENKFKLAKVVEDAYISLNSALEYYQTTTQRFRDLDLISNKRIRNMNAGEIELNVHKVEDKMFFGYEKTDVGDTTVFISNSEKTLIDCIYFSDIVYLGEIKKFIEVMKNKLDLEKIKRYLKKINNLSLNKRTGYLLELCGLDIGKMKINNKYTRLNKNLEKKGELNKKWKMIVNERL